MQCVTKLVLHNFKRFKDFNVCFEEGVNTVVGDNESGKSTILTAIELVASGSRSKVDSIGVETLLTKESVNDFFAGVQDFQHLPIIRAELYLKQDTNPDLHGKHNSSGVASSGLSMILQPNEELRGEIDSILGAGLDNFPYEYYYTTFVTFSGEAYSGYRNFLKCLFIDSSKISNEYANKEYTRLVYNSSVDEVERARLKNEYRQCKESFKDNNLVALNSQLGDYSFLVRTGVKSNLETDVVLAQDNIPLDERGKGQQCFIKTDFALSRNDGTRSVDILLLEEPENHLSHVNMKRLISRISEVHQRQIIIATHSSMISSRLDLRKSVLISGYSNVAIKLDCLSNETAKFFMKAPDNYILEVILSSKVILVEGDVEYMLIEELYSQVCGTTLSHDRIHVVSVGGTSFKRYMELAEKLDIRVAVLRDNDGDYQSNCVDSYTEYVTDSIKVFSDQDDDRYTFEVCLYNDNKVICDALFSGGKIKKSPLDYMLSNKTESAFRLLNMHGSELVVPSYIKRAIEWIR